jgi:hypothetical protein
VSNHAVTLLRFVPSVSKYFVADESGAFALLRPDTGVALVQTLPNGAAVTAACTSSEMLLAPATTNKASTSLLSSALLYVCASDASVHVFDAAIEARLGVLPSLLLSDPPVDPATGKPTAAPTPETVIFMQSVSIGDEQGAAAAAASSAQAAASSPRAAAGTSTATRQLFVCASSHALKLVGSSGSGKGAPETLMSVKIESGVRHVAVLTTPHAIPFRGDAQDATAPIAGGTAVTAPAPVAAPERCIAVLDGHAILRIYALNLTELSATPLAIDRSMFVDRNGVNSSCAFFSMTLDGRMAFLPRGSGEGESKKHVAALALASVFEPKEYEALAPPPALVHPAAASGTSSTVAADAALPSTAATDAAAAASNAGWFSSLRGAVSHESLFATPLFTETQFATASRRPGVGGSSNKAGPATEQARAREAEGDAARAHWDAVKASKHASAASSSAGASGSDAAVSNARREVSSAGQQMAQNKNQAELNLRRAEEVADKSEIMASHAGDFLAAARKLRQQQESSWF